MSTGMTYDFVRALCYSGLSLEHADGEVGNSERKYCPGTKMRAEVACTQSVMHPKQHGNEERSFSQLRYIQRSGRSQMSPETLRMSAVLFVNRDLE